MTLICLRGSEWGNRRQYPALRNGSVIHLLRPLLWATAIASIAHAADAEEGWKVYRDPALHYSFRYPASMRVEAAKVDIVTGRETDGLKVAFLGPRPLTFHWLEIGPVGADWEPLEAEECDSNWSEVVSRLETPSARISCGEDGAMGSTYRTLDYVVPLRRERLVIELVTRHLNDPEMQLDQNGEATALHDDLSEDEQRLERDKYKQAVAQSDELLDKVFERIVGSLEVR